MRCVVVVILIALASCNVATAAGVWKVRDVKAKSPFQSDQPTLNLDVQTDGNRTHCTVTDTTGKERAVTLAFCVPLDVIGGTWCDDPQIRRKITSAATQPYANLSNRAGGLTDEASLYPFAVVIDPAGTKATVIACPPDLPRMARFVYDAAARELRAEFDFGLSPLPEKFPSRADAAVVTYEVPGTWAFRRALEKYYVLFSECFVRRVKRAGIWMPFGEIGPIKNAADFGFAFHEIADGQANAKVLGDDEKIGCGSYVYIEPQTYWQYYHGKDKGTYEERLAQLEADAKAGDKISQATLVSGVIHANSKRDLYMEGVPYTTQLPWGNNPDPLVPADATRGYPNKATYEFDRVEPHLGWRDQPNLGVDGIYIDSMEGWGELLNYNKEHWRTTQFPLTFDPMNHNHVALLNFWGVYGFVREMSQRLHKHDMILFGNDAFYRRWQLAPWVDVPGREYTWTDDAGKLAPVEDEHYLFLRAMSGKRPYLMLMNNSYDDGSIMEPYFQRNLFYAVYPSGFEANQAANEVMYFSNPAWYERDRALFKKYIPLIRKLDEAGWEPVPFASVNPPTARIERYGSFEAGTLAFSVHNTSATDAEVTLTISRKELKLADDAAAKTWLSLRTIAPVVEGDAIRLTVHLAASGYDVVGIAKR